MIDSIQIHGYAKTAKEVKDKLKSYYTTFTEDFEGSNGRKKKTLWLTEVAMGSSDGQAVAAFAENLMNPKDGLTNRAPGPTGFGFVEKVSWFSEFFFNSFPMGNSTPAPFETWSSSLFNPFGGLSVVGETFFNHCGAVTPSPPTPPLPPTPSPAPPAPSPAVPTPLAPTPTPLAPTPPLPAPTPPVAPTPKPAGCPPCNPAQCKLDRCGAGAPYECTAGGAQGGCAKDSGFWPERIVAAPASCSACCDGTKC